jgi:hypothetical protein
MSLKTEKRKARKQRRLEANAAKLPNEIYTVDPYGSAEITLQAASSDTDEPSGPPRVRLVAYGGGLLRVANFPVPVVADISTLNASNEQYPLLLNHSAKAGVGHSGRPTIANGKLEANGVISHDSESSREVLTAHKNGFVWQPSIGLQLDPKRTRFIKRGQTLQANGRQFEGPVFYTQGATLKEISFVPLGGDSEATLKIAANAANGEDEMNPLFKAFLAAQSVDADKANESDLAKWKIKYDKFAGTLTASGFDLEAMAAEQMTILAASYTDEVIDPIIAADTIQAASGGDVIDEIAAERQRAAADRQRRATIEAACVSAGNPTIEAAGTQVDLAAHAIGNEWDIDRTNPAIELSQLRAARHTGPGAVSRSHEGDCTLQAMQGAMLLRAGVNLDDKLFAASGAYNLIPAWLRRDINDDTRQKFMEASHNYSDMSMVDLCREAVRLDGGQPYANRRQTIQAAFSGGTLANIWTTNVNARVLQGFEEEADSTASWTRQTDVADFKTNERLRLTKGSNLTKHARGGQADYAGRSDKVESYKIARYSKQFSIDEMDVIDDSFNALNDTPLEFGQAARRLRPDLVYSILLANGNMGDSIALFEAVTHLNLLTGAALTGTTLAAAITKLGLQAENGTNLNLNATHLIVPKTLEFLAKQIMNSAEVRETLGTNGTMNPVQGAVDQLVSDSRLDNGVTDPDSGTAYTGSTTDWYLASTQRPTIEVAYLRGSGNAPNTTTWTKRGEDGEWLMGWSVKQDIGAKAIEHLTLQKNEA